MRSNPNKGAGNYIQTPEEWALDDSMNWRNSRDFSPTCRKCNGRKKVFLPLNVRINQPLYQVCSECAGTGADAIPWSELFRNARLR